MMDRKRPLRKAIEATLGLLETHARQVWKFTLDSSISWTSF
jgi:hypothetical protein